MIAAKPEIRALGASVGFSLLGHAAGAAALIWLAAQMPPAPIRIAMPERTVDVVFEPPRTAPPVPDAMLQPAAQPAEPPVPQPPPAAVTAEPGPPSVSETPPPPVVETPPLPQPRKSPPVVHPKPSPPPKPAARKPPPSPPQPMARKPAELPPAPARVQQMPAPPPASPASPVPAYPSQQTAALPPSPAPVVSGAYRGMLSTWLESHKRYPEAARFRGEQGRVGLSFRVARSGQVLNFSITSSSGYAELDTAVEAMMRGAVLPPFPPEMTANDIQVNVTIRFGLDR